MYGSSEMTSRDPRPDESFSNTGSSDDSPLQGSGHTVITDLYGARSMRIGPGRRITLVNIRRKAWWEWDCGAHNIYKVYFAYWRYGSQRRLPNISTNFLCFRCKFIKASIIKIFKSPFYRDQQLVTYLGIDQHMCSHLSSVLEGKSLTRIFHLIAV